MRELDPSVRALIDVMQEQNKANNKSMVDAIERIDHVAISVNELSVNVAQYMVKADHQEDTNKRLEKLIESNTKAMSAKLTKVEDSQDTFSEKWTPTLLKAKDTLQNNAIVVRVLLTALIVASCKVLFDLKIGS